MRWSHVAFSLLALGCTNYLAWRPLDQPAPVKPHDLVWFWSGGAPYTWQAVVFTQDSISGIPSDMPVKCDSCRRSLPLTQVDSMRLGYYNHSVAKDGEHVLEGAGLVTLVLLLDGLVCYMVDRGNPQC